MVPNASIDRHSPGGAIMGGQAVGDDVGSMDHLQGCVRGRMLRLGQMTLMFFAGIRGALDSAVNESAKRTNERSATSAHPMAPAQENQGHLATAPISQQAMGPAHWH